MTGSGDPHISGTEGTWLDITLAAFYGCSQILDNDPMQFTEKCIVNVCTMLELKHPLDPQHRVLNVGNLPKSLGRITFATNGCIHQLLYRRSVALNSCRTQTF